MPKTYGGRWKTGDGLGQGGQGHVFRAVDITGRLTGEFALKVLNPERHDRFCNEIEAIKRLSHPNIINLIDHSALSETTLGEDRAFLVMLIAEGGDLSDEDRLTIYKGSVEAVLNVAVQVASALEAAHAAGVIHRDIKRKTSYLQARAITFGPRTLASVSYVLGIGTPKQARWWARMDSWLPNWKTAAG